MEIAPLIVTLKTAVAATFITFFAGIFLAYKVANFGATIMFAGNIPCVTQTMRTSIYSAVQANDYDLAFHWAMALIIFSLVYMILLNRFSNKN